MMKTTIEDKLTIIIPCKNENAYIGHLLDHLKDQNIGNTRIIIADCSTDNTRNTIHESKGNLNIEIIDGGPVPIAKNNGAKLALTPYILFIDSDVRFFSHVVILDSIKEMEDNDLHLIGLYLKCYDGDKMANICFMIFNLINDIIKYKVPFAVGSFMLTRRDKFEQFGGFAEHYETSEDFFLSKKYDVDKFKLVSHYVGQDSRRFRRMGYLGMIFYILKNFWNRNNENYWNNKNHSKYWK
jgi:glycosyltransferase involved in cell wall biosynthesis